MLTELKIGMKIKPNKYHPYLRNSGSTGVIRVHKNGMNTEGLVYSEIREDGTFGALYWLSCPALAIDERSYYDPIKTRIRSLPDWL